MPVIHPTKKTFLNWLSTILKYKATWKQLSEKDKTPTQVYRKEYIPQFEDFLKSNLPVIYVKHQILKQFRHSFYHLLNEFEYDKGK